jgi:hypothetical protein
MSKVGLTAATIIQQRLHNRDDIIINACCPGWIATGMSSYQGKLYKSKKDQILG